MDSDGAGSVLNGVLFVNADGRVELATAMALHMAGLGSLGVVGSEFEDLRGRSELLDATLKDVGVARSRGQTSRVVEVHRSGIDLSYVRVECRTVADFHGRLAGVLVVLEDVTGSHKSDQLRNQYLSIVAHELRTPLTGIKTFATMLAREKLGELTPNQREVAETIREQSIRLEHQIDKLVNLGFLDSPEYGQDLTEVDLCDLVRTAVPPFLQPAKDKQIGFSLELPDKPVRVRADRADLRRVLQALVENAVKFTPEKGTVQVSVALEGDQAVVTIADSGIGIDARYHGRIFEKFFQVEDPLTRHHGGAGLGLFVAQGIVRAHDSNIEVESRLGAGARFRFGLRLAQRNADKEVQGVALGLAR